MVILSFILFSLCFSYDGPDDGAGDPSATKESRMDGNRVLLFFKNTTQLSDWEAPSGLTDVSIWPNDGTGYRMLDGIGLLVGGKTYILDDQDETTIDTVIVDNSDEIELIQNNPNQNLHEVYFLQTSYREEMDEDELGLVKWGFHPVFGYVNSYQDSPALSDDPNTWPSAWPSTGTMTKWPGEWDGRFGRGVQYADLETYFVVNDAQDQEYLQNKWQCDNIINQNYGSTYDTKVLCIESCSNDEDSCIPTQDFEYYPRPGVKIPETSSVQPGFDWGGLGVRVEARGFQWNNPLVRDALFWEYNISNISDYNITEMAFGYWVDNAIGGGDTDDEVGYFDTQLNLAYSWDYDATGFGGGTPGIMGFAFLESPGISDDFVDNDNDGLLDESRTNDAGSIICATCGIADLNQFLEEYNLEESDLKEHYEGDEDQDWIFPVLDENNNCIVTNDDVGLDGVGPNDINYNGPDEGECNNRPDCVEGIGCEPNFGETDISESDMIGLTSFKLFPVDSHAEDPTTKWFKNDQVMWDSLMVISGEEAFDQFTGTPSNLIEVFSSSIFGLEKGKTERISMAEIHSMDNIQGSPGGDQQDVPALFALKKTIQLIYETDYRFAVPPDIPTLTAEAGDGHVVLTWNDIAESSIDRFLPDSLQNDFEGYKLYRATDKYFKDAQTITDGYGNPMFYEPIFQCDKIDSIRGFADYAPVFGAAYYLGDDTGLEHKYIDYDVDNGRTYYYAVVAYDYGLPANEDIESGIPPSENKALIELDENEYVVGTGPNVAVVIPSDYSAGFVHPWIDVDNEKISGTGTLDVEVYSQSLIEDNKNYMLTFENQTDSTNYLVTSGFNVYKEEGFCNGVECSSIISQNDCIGQYGCFWDNEICAEYPCLDYSQEEQCNVLSSCFWDDGIRNGTWLQSQDSLYFDIEDLSSFYGFQSDQDLILYGSLGDENDCFKFDFTYSSVDSDTLMYNIDSISRYGNNECNGSPIYGSCETDNFGIFNQELCIENGGIWSPYLDEYDISEFKFWNTENEVNIGGCRLSFSEECTLEDFGNSYCGSINDNNDCVEEDACDWNDIRLVYSESGEFSPISFYQNHFIYYENNFPQYDYWSLDPDKFVTTDAIDGLVFTIKNIESGSFLNSSWLNTGSVSNADEPIISINDRLEHIKPWDCNIVFTNNSKVYTNPSILDNSILDESDNDVASNSGAQVISSQGFLDNIHFDFYVYSNTLKDTLDLIVVDLDNSGSYEKFNDKILVGESKLTSFYGQNYLTWDDTNFAIEFSENYPEPDDIYALSYNIPFLESDTLFIHTNAPDSISIVDHDIEMDEIKVVPNPYVATNLMEEAFSNPNQNQERKIMFTHLPAMCEIKIFTVSGVLVNTIDVNNSYDDGKAYWDLLSNEGLEVAAGIYIYHVQSKINEKYALGKFAIVK